MVKAMSIIDRPMCRRCGKFIDEWRNKPTTEQDIPKDTRHEYFMCVECVREEIFGFD